MTRYNLQDIQSISRETDPCSLLVSLRDGGSCRFQVETASLAWEITNVVEQCIEGEDWHVNHLHISVYHSISQYSTVYHSINIAQCNISVYIIRKIVFLPSLLPYPSFSPFSPSLSSPCPPPPPPLTGAWPIRLALERRLTPLLPHGVSGAVLRWLR